MIARDPHCEACHRPQAETPGMLKLRKGGFPTVLCFDCIDDLKRIADEARKPLGAEQAAQIQSKMPARLPPVP